MWIPEKACQSLLLHHHCHNIFYCLFHLQAALIPAEQEMERKI
jgi:hypothetical protein